MKMLPSFARSVIKKAIPTLCKAPVSTKPKLKEKAIWAEPINPSAPSSSTPLELTNVNEIFEDYPHTDKILEILKSPMDLDKIVNPAITLEEGEIPPVMNLILSPKPQPPLGFLSESILLMPSSTPIPIPSSFHFG